MLLDIPRKTLQVVLLTYLACLFFPFVFVLQFKLFFVTLRFKFSETLLIISPTVIHGQMPDLIKQFLKINPCNDDQQTQVAHSFKRFEKNKENSKQEKKWRVGGLIVPINFGVYHPKIVSRKKKNLKKCAFSRTGGSHAFLHCPFLTFYQHM